MSGDVKAGEAGTRNANPAGPGFGKRLVFWGILVAVVCIGVEAASFVVYQFRHELGSLLPAGSGVIGLALDPYEMPDPEHPGNWVLRPGYVSTVQGAVAAKIEGQKVLGVERIRREAVDLQLDSGTTYIRINAAGFRGPELDESRSLPRVVTIGNSVTFGSVEYYSYPRTLERSLAQRGKYVEVVNAGVEGYGPRNVLVRMDRYVALSPQIFTVLLGWNALYGLDDRYQGWERGLYSVRVARRAAALIQTHLDRASHQDRALVLYSREKKPDPTDTEVARLDDYVPPFFPDLVRVIDRLESTNATVVVMTLPGLFAMKENPSDRALAIGHLPPYTDNPYVLARLTERYNQLLRDLAATRGLLLIDLAAWSDSALVPRDEYFVDSVHLTTEGQRMIGEYMADRLASTVDALIRRSNP